MRGKNRCIDSRSISSGEAVRIVFQAEDMPGERIRFDSLDRVAIVVPTGLAAGRLRRLIAADKYPASRLGKLVIGEEGHRLRTERLVELARGQIARGGLNTCGEFASRPAEKTRPRPCGTAKYWSTRSW